MSIGDIKPEGGFLWVKKYDIYFIIYKVYITEISVRYRNQQLKRK
jgi:hypothetical protein